VMQITFVMVPIRIAAFATMFHQGWTSRSHRTQLAPVGTLELETQGATR
jgi:hypothetical protein